MKNKYYVYGLYEEGSDTPFYIGKGSGRRVRRYSVDKKTHGYMLDCKFKNLQSKGKNLEYKILHDNLLEEDAFNIEINLIKKYGKRWDNTGILFNFTDGGDQPPSADIIRQMYGDEKFNEIKNKRKETFNDTFFIKNFENILKVQEMLNEDFLIRDIAKHLGFCRDTISRWIKIYNLNYDNTKKRLLEIERLEIFREHNRKKIQKTSKKYLVIDPNGDEFWVTKLVIFCRENNIDYRGLRNTFNKLNKDGNNCKYKGYFITQVIEPII
jgi:hypothetical protein